MIRTEKRLNANRHSLTADVKRGQGMRSLFYGKNLTGGINNEVVTAIDSFKGSMTSMEAGLRQQRESIAWRPTQRFR